MKNMTNAIIAKADFKKEEIVCGGSYQISRNSDEGKCILDFQGTAGTKSAYNSGVFEWPIWSWPIWTWLVFLCVAIIATVEFMSAVKQIYDWKKNS